MLEKNADVNCCFLCSVIFIEYYSTMHCNEVLQACQVDPIYCDIFGAAERVLRYGLPINLRYIFKRVPALIYSVILQGHFLVSFSVALVAALVSAALV